MKANFIDINNIFFSNTEKIATYLIFHLFGVLSCTNQSRNSTNSEVFASKLEDASRHASRHFFALNQNFIVQLCCGKRILLSPEKSSEGTLYSVPSFGGHIAISHDVTVYPFLVMARTVERNSGLTLDCSQLLYLHTRMNKRAREARAKYVGVGVGFWSEENKKIFFSVPTPYPVKSYILRWHLFLSLFSQRVQRSD